MQLDHSELLGRLLRQDAPTELGHATIGAVEQAIAAGDGALAQERLEYARKEWEIVHDMYVKWAWGFFTYIQQSQGEAGLEQAYRAILGSYYRDRYDKVMASSPETQLQLTLEEITALK